MRITSITRALAGAVLLVGCSSGGENDTDSQEAAAEQSDRAMVECAAATHALRREIGFVAQAAVDGVNESTFVAFADVIGQERDSADACSEEIQADLQASVTAVADLGGAVSDYYECRTKRCEDEAVNDLTTASRAVELGIYRAELTLGDIAVEAGAAQAQDTPLEEARLTCIGDDQLTDPVQYLSPGDAGRTLTLDLGAGGVEDEIDTAECIFDQLEMPDSTRNLIDNTTSLMGRQTDSWGEFEIAWSYHPDSGLSAVIEMVES